jgi:hypothetical protein
MTDASSFGRRAAALLAAESEHLPRVLDAVVLGQRHELVLEEASGPSLAALLAQRRRLPAGEAVTIVISAARAVAALHAAGFCGVSLDEAQLRFDAAGTPQLLGLDDAQETVVAGAQGPADDWRAVAALADRLGLVARTRAAGALGPAQVGLGLALATLTAGESAQNIERLEEALFELAEPEPVKLEGAGAAEPERPAPLPRVERRRAAHRRPSASVLIEAFDAGPAALMARPLGELQGRAARLLGRAQGRVRMLLVAGAIAVAITVLAIVLLPGKEPTQAGAADSRSASASPAAFATPSTTATHGSAAPALAGDDPVAAAAVLLAQRDGCLSLGDGERAACLAKVADGDASALDQPARPLAALAPSLLERSGDTALVALTPSDPQTAPASALLMRTEAGWRLRQLYEN